MNEHDQSFINNLLEERGLIRIERVLQILEINHCLLYVRIRQGKIPPGVAYGGRITCWNKDEITALVGKVKKIPKGKPSAKGGSQ